MINQLQNKKIIVNTDLDGYLSGAILIKYLGCELAGFSNSKDRIWFLNKDVKDGDILFLDMFVNDPNISCLDQHIVGADLQHNRQISRSHKKINPNLIFDKAQKPFDLYQSKYPFGTVHYLFYLMGQNGIAISELNDLNLLISSEISFGDIVLRADDAYTTSNESAYMDNASQWWKMLCSGDSINMALLRKWMNNSCKKPLILKTMIAQFFQEKPYHCDSGEAGFKNILKSDGDLKRNFIKMLRLFERIFKTEYGLDYDSQLFVRKGVNKRITLSQKQLNELMHLGSIDGDQVFSYAFVRSQIRESNFSYTILEDS